MIIGKINPGSGVGDMLFGYVATRIRAADLNVPFGFVGKEYFKGNGWMNLDFGEEANLKYHIEQPSGKLIVDDGHKLFEINTPYFNPEYFFIEDGTVIDGPSAQDIQYFEHRLDEVREWLKVEPLDMPDDLCVINFRGGEFSLYPNLFLTKGYWNEAIGRMKMTNPNMRFEVHTDDKPLAQQFFPDFQVIHDVGINWRSIRYARNIIIPNSAFPILPSLLNENVKEVIAPRFWAGRNIGEWQRPQNFYRRFKYI